MNNRELKTQYGPVAVVTGASSGIGKSFANLLATRGLDLVLVARRGARLEELATQLRADYGIQVTVCQADLAGTGATRQILDACANLDVGLVVSNAGFGFKGEFASGDAAVMTDMIMVNCNTPMLLARGFIPRLKARGNGGIILTSSVEGLIGCPYSTVYSATKGFVVRLGEGLWGELEGTGIDVLTLCPGATDTEAAALQGIDPKTLSNVMSPDEVARLTMDNIKNGPTFISSAHYQKAFDMLLAMPRRDALLAMAKSMKR